MKFSSTALTMAVLSLATSPLLASAAKDTKFQDVPAELVVSSSDDSSSSTKNNNKKTDRKKGKKNRNQQNNQEKGSYHRINGEMRATVAVPVNGAHMTDEAVTFFEGCVLTALEETTEEGLHALFVAVEEVDATATAGKKKKNKKAAKKIKKRKKARKGGRHLRVAGGGGSIDDASDLDTQDGRSLYTPKYSLYSLPGSNSYFFDIWSMITFECWSCDLFAQDDDDDFYVVPSISSSSSEEEVSNTWYNYFDDDDDDDDDWFSWRSSSYSNRYGGHRLLEDAQSFSLLDFQPRLCELLSEGSFEVFAGANDCHTFFVWN